MHSSCKKSSQHNLLNSIQSIYNSGTTIITKLYLLAEGIRNRSCKFAIVVVI